MLTDLAIRSAEPVTTLWDGTLKGFGIRVGRRQRTFIVLVASGRRQTIGHYPLMSLADARREARRILAEKQLGKVRPRFVAWDDAKERYLSTSTARAKTLYDYRRQLGHFSFGRGAVGDVSPRDILRSLNGLPPSEKRHAFAAVRTFLKWCVYEHIIDRSPCESLKTPPDNKSRERVLTEDELRAVWQATSPASTFNSIVRLLILTGLRRTECASLLFEWFDEPARLITIPGEYTKNARTLVVPYGDLATDVVANIPRLTGCPYLFPAARLQSENTTVFNGFSKSMSRLRATLGDQVEPFTIHDIRRTFATGMQKLGVRVEVTERMLGHVSGTQSGIVAVYQRYHWLPEMREAVDKWECHLNGFMVN
jgi:integrase